MLFIYYVLFWNNLWQICTKKRFSAVLVQIWRMNSSKIIYLVVVVLAKKIILLSPKIVLR